MSRRARLHGTRTVYRREVATAGRPVDAYLAAVQSMPLARGEAWITSVHHDDDCPAIETGPMTVCTCEIVEITARRVA